MTHFEKMVEAQILAVEGQRHIAAEFGALLHRLAHRLGDLLTRHGKLDAV